MTAFCRDCLDPLDHVPGPKADARCPGCRAAAQASPTKARARPKAARRLASGTVPVVLDEGGWPT